VPKPGAPSTCSECLLWLLCLPLSQKSCCLTVEMLLRRQHSACGKSIPADIDVCSLEQRHGNSDRGFRVDERLGVPARALAVFVCVHGVVYGGEGLLWRHHRHETADRGAAPPLGCLVPTERPQSKHVHHLAPPVLLAMLLTGLGAQLKREREHVAALSAEVDACKEQNRMLIVKRDELEATCEKREVALLCFLPCTPLLFHQQLA